jgi:hypothetical protein
MKENHNMLQLIENNSSENVYVKNPK